MAASASLLGEPSALSLPLLALGEKGHAALSNELLQRSASQAAAALSKRALEPHESVASAEGVGAPVAMAHISEAWELASHRGMQSFQQGEHQRST